MEDLQDTHTILPELMNWCLKRVPGREARNHRMALLLESFRDILNDQIPIITVAGTSGKGTVCSMLESVLLRGGMVPGVCMKPHLSSFCERIRISGSNVSNHLLELHTRKMWKRLKEFVEKYGPVALPSLYESILIIAGSIFKEQGVNVFVIEAAVGGSNDASSMLPSVLSILTSVEFDHQDILGDSIEAIAIDKAGIVRPGSTLVSGAGVVDEARIVVQRECARRGARLVQASMDDLSLEDEFRGGQTVKFRNQLDQRSITLRFPGHHQLANFATVWSATKVLIEMGLVTDSAVFGVEDAFLPGRFEFIEGSPSWLLDVAHNVASMKALIELTTRQFARRELIAILGATEPHDYSEFVRLVVDTGVPIGFVSGFPKAVSTNRLIPLVNSKTQLVGTFESPDQCVEHFLQQRETKRAKILVTGSLFLVGRIRNELSRRNVFVDRYPRVN